MSQSVGPCACSLPRVFCGVFGRAWVAQGVELGLGAGYGSLGRLDVLRPGIEQRLELALRLVDLALRRSDVRGAGVLQRGQLGIRGVELRLGGGDVILA